MTKLLPTKFTIPSHIVTAFYGIDQEAPYAVVRLYIALRYEGDGEAELGHGSRGSGSRTDLLAVLVLS